jgi:hypothetical protein
MIHKFAVLVVLALSFAAKPWTPTPDFCLQQMTMAWHHPVTQENISKARDEYDLARRNGRPDGTLSRMRTCWNVVIAIQPEVEKAHAEVDRIAEKAKKTPKSACDILKEYKAAQEREDDAIGKQSEAIDRMRDLERIDLPWLRLPADWNPKGCE